MTTMGRITYNPETRSFSGQTAIGKVAGATAEAVGAVGNAVEAGAEKVAQGAKKTKRSFGELIRDIVISPKTKEDRLRRRAAISFALSTLSAGAALKNHIDKNNANADRKDTEEFQNELVDYMSGKRKTMPKKRAMHTGLGATADYWKAHYNTVKNWLASTSDTEDENMASLSEEYRDASKEESGRMKKALNDMANRCRAKSVGF